MTNNNSKSRHAELAEELMKLAPPLSMVQQDYVRDALELKTIPQLEALIKTYKAQGEE
jgi:hypothetical protein